MPDKISGQIDLFRYIDIIWEKKWLIVVTGLIFFLAACGITIKGAPNLYSASATVFNVINTDEDMSQALYSGVVIRGYSDVATSLKVMNKAAELLGYPGLTGHELREIISIHSNEASQIITIQAVTDDPSLAVSAANIVAVLLVREINEMRGRNMMQALDMAVDYSITRKGVSYVWMIRAAVTFAAMVASCMAVVAVNLLSPKVNTVNDATLHGEMKLLGMIPDITVKNKGG